MLNNNPNPLRAAYPELGNRTAMEALRGAGIYVGPGPVPDWAKVQLDPTGGDVVTTAAGVACTPPAGMPGVTDVQKAVDALIPYEVGTWTPQRYSPPGPDTRTWIFSGAEYIKLGQLVLLRSNFTISVAGTPSGTHAFFSGLPYPDSRHVSGYAQDASASLLIQLAAATGYFRVNIGGNALGNGASGYLWLMYFTEV